MLSMLFASSQQGSLSVDRLLLVSPGVRVPGEAHALFCPSLGTRSSSSAILYWLKQLPAHRRYKDRVQRSYLSAVEKFEAMLLNYHRLFPIFCYSCSAWYPLTSLGSVHFSASPSLVRSLLADLSPVTLELSILIS